MNFVRGGVGKYFGKHMGDRGYSGFLYNRGDGINVVMDKKVEILIMVS